MSKKFRTETLAEGITLILGDCGDVLKTIGRVDAMVTDPPYGVELKERVTKFSRRSARESYEDNSSFVKTDIVLRVKQTLDLVKCASVTPGTRSLFLYPEPAEIGCVYFQNGAGRSRWGFGCFNPILFYGKDPYLANGLGSRPNSVSTTHWFADDVDHPAAKPIKWMEWMVNRTSLPGWTVLDPFMGSGTTGIACARLERKFVGIEINERYFDLACSRISKELQKPDFLIKKPKPLKQQFLIPLRSKIKKVHL